MELPQLPIFTEQCSLMDFWFMWVAVHANHWHLAIVNHRLIKKGVNKQTNCGFESPLGTKFFSTNVFKIKYALIVKVTKTELRDINRLIGYNDTHWYIKDPWIDFSARNIVKQAVAHCTFMASRSWGCLKWRNYCL